ncbi:MULTISPECIES: MFS transporter [Acidobacteriaceae]|uniref:MFS transporter n=1 Tax=Acidobacteriaceae TaxID=204434 RepID=UPI00131AE835|nr:MULTISPECIES: MFS transporter [Acidobacteriaceae]MDW5265921.1 MFS transporter [Edaphobacter sp.]
MPDETIPGLDSARAWIVVFAGFVGSFVTFGISYCFGVFLKPIGLEFHVSHAAMSALFSMITAISFFAAPFTGKIADRYGPRPVVVIGALLLRGGMIFTAHVHSFALLFLTYGVGLGGGVACTYIPSVSAVGQWFKKHRDVALGLTISGIGCGTLVAAPLSAMLIERHGWRTAFEIFGWGGAALLLLCAALLFRPPVVGEKKKGAAVAKVRTRAFAIQYISLFFSGIAIYASFVFLPAYAGDIGASRVAGAGLIGYIGASSVVGRLGLDALAPRFGLMRMYQASYLILLISFGVWLAAGSYTALVVFALLMGVGYGGIAAMSPAVAASTFGIEGLGELLGILFTGLGAACLVGPPVAGILVDHFHDYKWPVFVGAGASVLALLFAILLQAYANKPTRR